MTLEEKLDKIIGLLEDIKKTMPMWTLPPSTNTPSFESGYSCDHCGSFIPFGTFHSCYVGPTATGMQNND